MSTKHTPGPWEILDDYTPEGRVTIIANIDGEYFTDSPSPRMTFDVIAVCEDAYGDRLDNHAANARLIAAAPDLLSALQALDADWTEAIPHGPGEPGEVRMFSEATLCIWRAARAAIAKAEGRS